jgi:guanine deaminase
MTNHIEFMREAISMAKKGSSNAEGGPFGAVVVKNNEIIGRGNNQVLRTNDPTAHAEIVAIRDACKNLGHFQLDGCIIYTSCEPCPMCLGAIYWARPEQFFFACTRKDAADIGFDDEFIYMELALNPDVRKIKAIEILREEALEVFRSYAADPIKRLY